jgi:site-specific DNA-methyltransferase (adenine-specific)
MKKMIDNGIEVDFILTDPPYGTMKNITNFKGWSKETTAWDNRIPTNEMFNASYKLLRLKSVMILFSQEPYTTHLRSSCIENFPFVYPLYWLKDHFANNLSAKKAPVNYIEELSVFRKKYDMDSPLRKYSKELLSELNMTRGQINKVLGHRRAEHFFYSDSLQFEVCKEDVYNEMIEKLNIDECECFKPYDEVKKYSSVFNLRGNNFKSNVFEYKRVYRGDHPTQKPVDLLKDLILTYTNPGDTVLDFTMGSGSTGVACLETERDFIGIELEEKYYNIAKKRCGV